MALALPSRQSRPPHFLPQSRESAPSPERIWEDDHGPVSNPLLMLTLTQVWGALLIFILCPPDRGAAPNGMDHAGRQRQGFAGNRHRQRGGIGGFLPRGAIAGVPAVLSEAAKGIGAVLLARHYFPTDPVWEIVALIALVMGRYWGSQGAGTTNVMWGFIVHDWVTAGLGWLLSLIGFTVVRQRRRVVCWP
jgi:hypothetical protein